MKIIVCMKQVPDTTEIKIDPVTNTLMRKGVPSIVNPFDAYALELAVRLKEEHGGTVTVVSMGPDQAKAALKECLSVGADNAILVSDRAFGGSDTLATSYILSTVIKKIGDADLILCGKQAIDGDTGQVGPEIAEHLNIAQVTYASDVELKGDKIIVNRESEEGFEVIEAEMPTVVSVIKTKYEPRYPTMKSKLAANRAQIDTITSADLDIDLSKAGLKGSPTKVVKTFTPQRKKDGVIIEEESSQEAVTNLLNVLADAKLI